MLEQDCNIPHAIPFSELNISVPLPDKRNFPNELQTIASHIKHARLERRMLIKDVLTELNINRETLRGWESKLFAPHISHYPSIIRFLGYYPFKVDTDSLAEKIKCYRHKHGLTQQQFATLLQTHASIIWQWECNGRIPLDKTQKRISELIDKP